MTAQRRLTALIVDPRDRGLAAILENLEIRVLKADSGPQALQTAAAFPIDLVFADAVCTGMPPEALFRTLQQRFIRTKPGCALTCLRGFPVLTDDFPVLYYPFSAEETSRILPQMLAQTRYSDPQLLTRASALLSQLGVPENSGKTYLCTAIALALSDASLLERLSARLYPPVAAQHETTPAQVERAIRRCIDAAWNRGPSDVQYRLFGNTIDPQRGKPTIGQMIARCADILRLEGFQ